MCDPVTATLVATSLAGTMQGISQQNKAASANRANAMQAQNNSIDQLGQQQVEQNRSLIQQGFDATLAGREAASTASVSAAESGVQGNSVRAMMRSKSQIANRGAARTGMEMSSLRTQAGSNLRGLGATTQGRINSVPTTRFGIGDAASALMPIANKYAD